MARIAIIADIHANPHAFRAVLDDIDTLEVDEIIINGDMVGRGPLNSEVLSIARRHGLSSTRGNHEDFLLDIRRDALDAEWDSNPTLACYRWMSDGLTDEDVEHLESLPFSLVSSVDPRIRLFHGSPASHMEGLGDWTEEHVFREHLDAIDEPVLVVAHTHRPLVRRLGDELVVNVGSVGLPFNGDTRAQYALFETDDERVEVTHRQVDWDHDLFLADYESTGFLEAGGATAQMLALEVKKARPHLVPFIKWAEIVGRETTRDSVEDFLEFYDPERSLRDFLTDARAAAEGVD